jgi:phenylpropionate dioxygenase-like ring-hydroxylating dioxygenase large terminal subunit
MPAKFPAGSEYDENTWNVLAGFWHPITRAQEIGEAPQKAMLLDVPLVAYRTNLGIFVATDICPHRGARLSSGWVKDNRLVCPYHGLEFDGTGQCVRVPASEPHKDNCDAIHLETVKWCERYGIIWVCLLEEPTRALPEWPGLEDDDTQVIPLPGALWNASAGRHAENFNDVAHLSFIHAGTFGNRDDPLVERYEVVRTDVGLDRTFHYNQVDRDSFDDQSGTITKMTYAYRYNYPFSSELIINSPDGRNLHIYDCICPLGPTQSLIFISLARDYDKDLPVQDMIDFQTAVNAEDQGVVESQLPKLVPMHPRSEKHIAADAWSMEFRSGFVRLGLERSAGI